MKSRLEANIADWKGLTKVAWLRSGALGDLVVGAASLAEMARFFPHARVTVIGPKLWLELLDPRKMPFLERIIVVARKSTVGRAYAAHDGGWREEGGGELPLTEFLKGYQALVNTNTDSYRYGFQAMKAGVGLRIGSASAEMAWLYHYNAPFFGKDPLLHERDLPLLLMEYATPGLAKYFRTTGHNRASLNEMRESSRLVEHWRREGLPSLRHYTESAVRELTGLAPKSYFLVNPSASRREKAWPSARVRELLLDGRAEFNFQPLVIGAPNETEWLREVAGAEFKIIQPRNLTELQEIVHGARVLLTNVSSMQFIAATTKTPTLTVVGRAEPRIWGPVGAQDQMVIGRREWTGANAPSSAFEEETRIYESITPAEVKPVLLKMLMSAYFEKRMREDGP